MRGSLGNYLVKFASVGIIAHVVLTTFENSPDAKVSFGKRNPVLGRLPQWRFFAPTPGVDNTHLFYRVGVEQTAHWSD
jgi:hypothetical protein